MKKKTLTIAIALVLVVALAVGATWAYLTATTGPVENTFVAGGAVKQSDLKLYEHKANQNKDGTYTLDTKTPTTANSYTVMPGVDLPKDPTVEVAAANGPYYLFVKVTEGANFNKNIFGYSIDDTAWKQLKDADDKDVAGVYVYTIDKTNAAILTGAVTANVLKDKVVKVADADSITLAEADCTLTFQAYACQSAGFNSAYEAFNTCFGK